MFHTPIPSLALQHISQIEDSEEEEDEVMWKVRLALQHEQYQPTKQKAVASQQETSLSETTPMKVEAEEMKQSNMTVENNDYIRQPLNLKQGKGPFRIGEGSHEQVQYQKVEDTVTSQPLHTSSQPLSDQEMREEDEDAEAESPRQVI